ncbi:nucleoside triphosphate pyrophosphohydrolase family protein [Rhodococcus aerolatus]
MSTVSILPFDLADQGIDIVLFDDYQDRITLADPPDDMLGLLGIGAHAGALLEAHRNYLRSQLDAVTSRALVRRQLGELMGHVAGLASCAGLGLEEIARANVHKIQARARVRNIPQPETPFGKLTVEAYQKCAAITDEQAPGGMDPLALSVPMLGLAGEAGTLLVAQKKAYRDQDPEVRDPGFLTIELGDVLWYVAAVATHSSIQLAEALQEGLDVLERRTRDLVALAELPLDLPILDVDFPVTERLPRQLIFRFRQTTHGDDPRTVHLTLEHTSPNVFPDGPVPVADSSKTQGYSAPGPFGDPLTDNSRRSDAYRFHDAIHLGFLAVMGWSPNTRSLLGLKRRSSASVDVNEDGARAIFAEEGMAAVLAKRAPTRQGFLSEEAVDDEVVEMLVTVFEDLEVSRMPSWLWKRAVQQGFAAMDALHRSGGGFLTADLDSRTLQYARALPSAVLR